MCHFDGLGLLRERKFFIEKGGMKKHDAYIFGQKSAKKLIFYIPQSLV